ncbi:hypothetical protein HME9304_02948 [Flagellimonas maritima]|uniref:YD repeat-containing protein n=1 Tax=Flagellimonas maritima TaxID=1383885 RepID=A0A2Z4LVS9_9FLAO|nr:hypothetical protein [Allomuricauda aurantiaca]AWX45916.1 hypothetical protein HME9304_02948 [Allomuricauda aurantiaca]
MVKNYGTFLSFFFLLTTVLQSQEIQIFTVEDFDLKGKVKTCLVITDYGKELFEFNENGYLAKTVTQYNDTDQDITYYKYSNGELLEKRMESYKNNVLDASTSMANFYTIDTVPQRKILEKIISYDKEFLEQQEYQYDDKNRLTKIVTSNEDGVDETTVEYTPYKNELTISFFFNSVIEKSIRTSKRQGKNGTQKVVLTKEYIDGEPNRAVEEIYNADDKLVSKEVFRHSMDQKKFVMEQKLFYSYDSDGMLNKITTKTKNSEAVEEYIFQFDSSEEKNWIKQIITPNNTYTTRKITYYIDDETEEG